MSKTVVLNVDMRRITRRFVYTTDKATCFRCGEKGHLRDMCFKFRVHLCSVPNCQQLNCVDAHNVEELRYPQIEKCVRVVKDKTTGKIYKLGCLQQGHTFRACPNKTCSLCATDGHWYYECSLYPCNIFEDTSKLLPVHDK